MNSTRYEVIARNYEALAYSETPLWILATALLKDTIDDKTVAQIKFLSISDRPISAVIIKIECVDITGTTLSGLKDYQYLDLKVKRGDVFGQQIPIVLPDNNTRRIKIFISKIVFSDDSTYISADQIDPIIVPVQDTLISAFANDDELAYQFSIDTKTNGTFMPDSTDRFWRCTCGTINHKQESYCVNCKAERELLFSIINDLKRLEENKNVRLKQNQQIEEERKEINRKEAELFQANKKRRNILFACLSAGVMLLVIFIFTLTNVLIPSKQYRDAEESLTNGDYYGASQSFLAAGNYKNATERVFEPYYIQGVNLLANAEYDGAIAAFQLAGDYPDASESILKAYYQKGEKLLAEENFEGALNAFKMARGYNDASERKYEVYYKQAEKYIETKSYDNAVNAFIAAEDYKDAEERINEPYYIQALALFESNHLLDALPLFEKADGYNDSEEKIIEIKSSKKYMQTRALFDSIYFGSYEQDNDTSNGKEPIEWVIIGKEDGKLLLLSKYSLDYKPFNEGKGVRVRWATCTLRQWLNTTFKAEAFTEQLETAISPTNNDNVVDKVFILSRSELGSIRGKGAFFGSASEFAKGFDDSFHDLSYMWLVGRNTVDQGYDVEYYYIAYFDEENFPGKQAGPWTISSAYIDIIDHEYIRPALWIDLSLLN